MIFASRAGPRISCVQEACSLHFHLDFDELVIFNRLDLQAGGMMIIDLNGSWQLREALGETWRWYLKPKPVSAGNNVGTAASAAVLTPGWMRARVPSSVRGDLLRADEVPSPYIGRNSKETEWVSQRSWLYRRAVSLPRPLKSDEVALLELEAVDPCASVYIDGNLVDEVTGPFRTNFVDVTKPLADGKEHQLIIVLPPAPVSEPQVGRTGNVRIHAPRMTYGWDFCPRLVHQGIWQSVRLSYGRIVDNGTWVSSVLGADCASGKIDVHVRMHGVPGQRMNIDVSLNGRKVASAADVVADDDGCVATEIVHEVSNPELWWPYGFGDQRLYRVELQVGGDSLWSRKIGFRSAQWKQNPGAPQDSEPYNLYINGSYVRLTGWNWAPVDALYGEIDRKRIANLLKLVRNSGAHLLRVWGGGLIETQDFYDLADELGILVWQEFSQSSSGMQSAPSESPEFVELMRSAVRDAVRERGYHASLVMWGGGNELDKNGVPLRTEDSPALLAMSEELKILDPARRWVSTSPTGPVFHNRLDVIAKRPGDLHDVHGPWEHQGLVDHYHLYNAGTCLAHTEFGVEGMSSQRQFKALIPGDLRPLDRTNPLMRHLGEWWNNAQLVRKAFGGRLVDAKGQDDVEAIRRGSQLLQATGLEYAVESDLRREPHCSMVLPWQLAESYPNAWCTSAIEYYGDIKPSYQAVRRAFEERRVSLKVDRAAWAGCKRISADAWVWADSHNPVCENSTITLSLNTVRGEQLASDTWHVGAVDAPREVGSLAIAMDKVMQLCNGSPLDSGAILVWVAQWKNSNGAVIDEEATFFSTGSDWSALCDVAEGQVDVSLESNSGSDCDRIWNIQVKNTGSVALIGLGLRDNRPAAAQGYLRTAFNPMPLMPGGNRTISLAWDGVVPRERDVSLYAWNLSARSFNEYE